MNLGNVEASKNIWTIIVIAIFSSELQWGSRRNKVIQTGRHRDGETT